MAEVAKTIAHFETTLVDGIDKDSTTMSLDSVSTPAGNLPSGLYGFVIEQESTSKREYVIGTLSGSVLTFTVRDVSPLDGSTADSSSEDARQKHRKGSSIKLTDHPALTTIYQMIAGLLGLDSTSPILYDAEPTLSAREELATVGYVLDNVNGGDVSYSRLIHTGNGGETLVAGDWIFFNVTDQEWYKADADTSYVLGTQFGVAQGAGTDGGTITGGILIKGTDTNQTGLTAGDSYYLSATAGAVTNTAPSNQFFVGVAKSTTAMLVNFDASQLFQMKTGMIMPFAVSTAPSGWLNCDGSDKLVATYLDLFNVLNDDNLPFGVGTASTFTADDSTDIITSATHNLSNGDVIFARSTTTLPAGLTADTAYYIIEKTTNTFKVSLTLGGSAVDITDTGTGTHSWYNNFKLPDLESRMPLGYSGGAAPTKAFTFVDADVNTGTDVITIDSNDDIHTGTPLALTTDGVLPAGLSATTYYAIKVSATTLKLATTVANANAGTQVDITAAAGGGTHTLTHTLTQRDIGDEGGEEIHALADGEMPSHSHPVSAWQITPDNDYATFGSGSANGTETTTTSAAGSDTPHNTMNPYTVVNYIIKT